MNLGDGLLFELENGKPKLILLSQGVEKNPKKLSFRPTAANILSSKQPSCVEEVKKERPVRHSTETHREVRSKVGGGATSFTSSIASAGGKNCTLTLSKAHENNKGGTVKATAKCIGAVKVKSERHKHSPDDGTLPSNGKMGQPQKTVLQGSGKDMTASGNTGPKDSVTCLTSEQLQQSLNTVQTSSNGLHLPEDHSTEGNQTGSTPCSSVNGRVGERMQDDSGRGEKLMNGGGVTRTSRSSQEKDRLSGCLFSWLEEGQADSRATIDAKKAQWRRELDEQVAMKQQQQQQRLASGRLQVEENRDGVLSVQSSISHREQPTAIKSSLNLGDITPMEEVLNAEKKGEQRRRWLEELDRQREEMTERKRREKLLQSQAEDHELWATHFDSLQKRPPLHSEAPSAPPSVPIGSERGEWEPSSSLSLVWEATSSYGAESVGTASVDTSGGYQTRASYLRTMTALLDPTQIEERERKRLKQLEQQRAIEVQLEERRRQREQEEAKRRKEEEEEERRVAMEREMMQRLYKLDSVREQQKEQANNPGEQSKKSQNTEILQEKLEPSVTRLDGLEKEVGNIVSPYKDIAVQTEAFSPPLTAESLQPLHITAKHQVPPPQSDAPPTCRSRATRTGKENMCLRGGGGGGDRYEAFAKTDRSRSDKRRPEWNTQRPSRRFVPASERYPAALQRDRQESRLKRQAELLALQERACPSRTEPPPQKQEPHLCSNPTQTRVECVSRGQSISAGINSQRHGVQSQQASSPSPSALQFVPYVRTDEVFSLDPLEPANTPHSDTCTEDPPQRSASAAAPSLRDPLLNPELLRNTHTHRQQEILKGLAQLRQRLLQKQRELETDLNPLTVRM